MLKIDLFLILMGWGWVGMMRRLTRATNPKHPFGLCIGLCLAIMGQLFLIYLLRMVPSDFLYQHF